MVVVRIPIAQYAYVEVQGEFTPEIARETYNDYLRVFTEAHTSLPERDYNKFIDRQLNGEDGNHIDDYNQMSEMQKFAVQVIKRGIKRINYKNNE